MGGLTANEREYTLVAGTYFDRDLRKSLRPGAKVTSRHDLAKRWPRTFIRSDDPSLAEALGKGVKQPAVKQSTEKVALMEPCAFELSVKKSGRGRVILYSVQQPAEDGTCREPIRLHQKTVPTEQVGFIQDHDFAALWVPVQMFKGQDVFLLGGGPSLKGFDYSRLAGKNVIGVNDAYLKGDWPVTIFGDAKWFFTHHETYRRHAGLKVTNHPEFRGYGGVFAMRRVSSHPTCPQDLPWGTTGNTGLAAIWLAASMGARRAILLGYDCKIGPNGESNWHENNLTVNTPKTYMYFNTAFRAASVRIPEHFPKFKVVNAGPDSALTNWPKLSLEEVL